MSDLSSSLPALSVPTTWGRSRVVFGLFALQLGGLWLVGVAASAMLGRVDLSLAAFVASLSLAALTRAVTAANDTRWAAWRGPLAFLSSWLVFPLFRGIHDVFVHHPADTALLNLDRALWGGQSLPEHLLGWERPGLSELFSAGYLAFFLIILIPVVVHTVRRRTPEAVAFFTGLTLMYAIGFLGYVTVPACGPFLAFPDRFPYPLQGGPLTALLTHVVHQGITGMDVFPSLHSGISTYVLGFLLWRRRFAWAALLAPVVATLIVAALYLRYHYGVDLLCGLLLAAGVLALLPVFKEPAP